MSVGSIGFASNLAERGDFVYPARSITQLIGHNPRDKPHDGRYSWWGTNSGSIRIDGERVPIDVPRVRDTEAGEERPLESYRSMKQADAGKNLTESILLGLAQGDYERVASPFIDGFGLSQSSVSRRFQERAEGALNEFENRSLKDDNFLALWIAGKHVAGKHVAGERVTRMYGRDGGRIQWRCGIAKSARLHANHDRERAPSSRCFATSSSTD